MDLTAELERKQEKGEWERWKEKGGGKEGEVEAEGPIRTKCLFELAFWAGYRDQSRWAEPPGTRFMAVTPRKITWGGTCPTRVQEQGPPGHDGCRVTSSSCWGKRAPRASRPASESARVPSEAPGNLSGFRASHSRGARSSPGEGGLRARVGPPSPAWLSLGAWAQWGPAWPKT